MEGQARMTTTTPRFAANDELDDLSFDGIPEQRNFKDRAAREVRVYLDYLIREYGQDYQMTFREFRDLFK